MAAARTSWPSAKLYPEIEIHLAVGNTAQVAAAVESGAAELGFVEGAVSSDHFDSKVVARDQLIVVVAPDHPWTTRFASHAQGSDAGRMGAARAGSGTRSAFEEALMQSGLKPSELRVELELPSNEAVRAAVEAGLGSDGHFRVRCSAEHRGGLLQQLRYRLPEREFHVLRHLERYQSRAADALLSMIKSASRG